MATPTERPEVNTVHIHPNEVCKTDDYFHHFNMFKVHLNNFI